MKKKKKKINFYFIFLVKKENKNIVNLEMKEYLNSFLSWLVFYLQSKHFF